MPHVLEECMMITEVYEEFKETVESNSVTVARAKEAAHCHTQFLLTFISDTIEV